MSAYIVSEAHINVLVNYAASRDVSAYWQDQRFAFRAEPARLAAVLHTANVEAVSTRYGEDTPSEDFCHQFLPRTDQSPVRILKALACYAYQTGGLTDYCNTLACALVEAIRAEAIGGLPGYDDAPWHIDDGAAAAWPPCFIPTRLAPRHRYLSTKGRCPRGYALIRRPSPMAWAKDPVQPVRSGRRSRFDQLPRRKAGSSAPMASARKSEGDPMAPARIQVRARATQRRHGTIRLFAAARRMHEVWPLLQSWSHRLAAWPHSLHRHALPESTLPV